MRMQNGYINEWIEKVADNLAAKPMTRFVDI